MCAGKAFNNHRTAIRDALIKIFVEERTPANVVENKVIAAVFGVTSMQPLMDIQADRSKLLLDTALIPEKACIWETKTLWRAGFRTVLDLSINKHPVTDLADFLGERIGISYFDPLCIQ